ncbi:MAG: hypothetical protein ACC647_09375 [Anaerolineales bacterium]
MKWPVVIALTMLMAGAAATSTSLTVVYGDRTWLETGHSFLKFTGIL